MERRCSRRFIAFVAMGVGAAGCGGAEPETLTGDDIDRISEAVVRVVSFVDGEVLASGSGTIVDRGGLIFTNRHVVAGGDDFGIEMLYDSNELPAYQFRARLAGYSPEIDFAQLQIDRDNEGREIQMINLPWVELAERGARRGDRISVFGYPVVGDGYLTYSEGVVAAVRNGPIGGQRVPAMYQTDAHMEMGHSGGLAVNARGEMVGIPTSVQLGALVGSPAGGVLALEAVNAALDAGLETDPIIASSVPATGGGECRGFAAAAPDFRLEWSGSSPRLRILFEADEIDDATLLVNLPDGSWACSDDYLGSLDPGVVLRDPAEGRYDVWVGSYDFGTYASGTLSVSEASIPPGEPIDWPEQLAPEAEPDGGYVQLRAGEALTPHLFPASGGGPVDASYLGGECRGYTISPPDMRLTWSGRTDALRIFFEAKEAGDDAALIARLPDGSWVCNDDAVTLDPLILLPNPADGQYDVWIAAIFPSIVVQGTLGVTESPLLQR